MSQLLIYSLREVLRVIDMWWLGWLLHMNYINFTLITWKWTVTLFDRCWQHGRHFFSQHKNSLSSDEGDYSASVELSCYFCVQHTVSTTGCFLVQLEQLTHFGSSVREDIAGDGKQLRTFTWVLHCYIHFCSTTFQREINYNYLTAAVTGSFADWYFT